MKLLFNATFTPNWCLWLEMALAAMSTILKKYIKRKIRKKEEVILEKWNLGKGIETNIPVSPPWAMVDRFHHYRHHHPLLSENPSFELLSSSPTAPLTSSSSGTDCVQVL